MNELWMLGWWNLIFIVPFGLALLYLGLLACLFLKTLTNGLRLLDNALRLSAGGVQLLCGSAVRLRANTNFGRYGGTVGDQARTVS